MTYRVKITDCALGQLDEILDYIVNELGNPDAAARVLRDYDNAIEKLEKAAAAFPICAEPELAQHNYRKYHLEKHRYILLYRIAGQEVFIHRIYHELQDYFNLEA